MDDTSLLLRFYRGERVHPNGRTFAEIMAKMDSPQRMTGGVIQWLFPSATPSRHVPRAPVLFQNEIQLFKVGDPCTRGASPRHVNGGDSGSD